MDDTTEPERSDADTTPDDAGGTATGNPVAGIELNDEEQAEAVEPEDNGALEVDGPQAGHA